MAEDPKQTLMTLLSQFMEGKKTKYGAYFATVGFVLLAVSSVMTIYDFNFKLADIIYNIGFILAGGGGSLAVYGHARKVEKSSDKMIEAVKKKEEGFIRLPLLAAILGIVLTLGCANFHLGPVEDAAGKIAVYEAGYQLGQYVAKDDAVAGWARQAAEIYMTGSLDSQRVAYDLAAKFASEYWMDIPKYFARNPRMTMYLETLGQAMGYQDWPDHVVTFDEIEKAGYKDVLDNAARGFAAGVNEGS
jgi:hypothetical protein